MSVPNSRISKSLALHIIQGDCGFCWLGDSTGTDNSSASNIPFGIHRTWSPTTWSGRFGRPNWGPPSWAMTNSFDSAFYTLGLVTPGESFSAGGSGISPNVAADIAFTGNTSQFHTEASFDLNDAANYAVGNVFTGVPCKARLIWFRDAGMAKIQLVARRNATEIDWPGTVVELSGVNPGFLDVDCGEGVGAPGLEIRGSDEDETGKYAFLFAVGMYVHDGEGNRVPGFVLSQIGEGGWNTEDHVDTGQCSDSSLATFLEHTLAPNTFAIMICNQTGAEQTTLGAGDPSDYEDNIRAVITRYEAAAALAGADAPIRWLLINPYDFGSGGVGRGATNAGAQAQALYNVANEDPENRGFVNLYELADKGGGGENVWYAPSDGIHPDTAGAEYIAGLLWTELQSASTQIEGPDPKCMLNLLL